MDSYISVSSNDGLMHQALPGSPETLCGHLVSNTAKKPVDLSMDGAFEMVCDVCRDLSNNQFINVSATPLNDDESEPESPCPYCEDGRDYEGNTCWNCNGTGWIQGEWDTFNAQDVESLQGSRVAKQASIQKDSLNYTLEGLPIRDGFNVILTKEEASRIPFLDLKRVSISEKRECPDCNDIHWLDKIASCTDCGQMKCKDCMTSIRFDSFLGKCKKCANDESFYYDEDPIDMSSIQFNYLMNLPDEDIDPLFLTGE